MNHSADQQQSKGSGKEQDRERARGESTQTTNRITGGQRWWALAAVLITIFFASLDQTVVATALPVIVGELKGFSIYAWVFTAYLLGSAVTVPLYGKLSDVFGRKPFYILGIGIFMVFSALSGQSHSMIELVVFRGFQGLGAGGMLSMPRATIGDIFTPRERGRWMAVFSVAFGLSSIVGPFLGGWITDHLGWRWVFYINLPVAALALAGIIYALPRVRIEERVTVDWFGAGLLVLGLVPLLLAFTWGGHRFPWISPEIVGLFAFSAATLALYTWVEIRSPDPIIPVEYFRVPLFSVANLIGLLLSMAMYGTLLFLPLYVQGVLDLSAQNSGAILTPMMASFVLSALIAGQLMTRTGKYKVVSIVTAAIATGGLYLFTRLEANSTYPTVIRDMVILGLGLGALLPILSVAVQNAFPYRVMGVVNGAQQFMRSLGAVIATPLLGTIMANTFSADIVRNLPPAIEQALSSLPPAERRILTDPQSLTNSQTQAAIKSMFAAFGSEGNTLYHEFIDVVHKSLTSGIRLLFLIAFFWGIAMLVATLFLPEIPLQREEFFEEEEDKSQESGERSGGD